MVVGRVGWREKKELCADLGAFPPRSAHSDEEEGKYLQSFREKCFLADATGKRGGSLGAVV